MVKKSPGGETAGLLPLPVVPDAATARALAYLRTRRASRRGVLPFEGDTSVTRMLHALRDRLASECAAVLVYERDVLRGQVRAVVADLDSQAKLIEDCEDDVAQLPSAPDVSPLAARLGGPDQAVNEAMRQAKARADWSAACEAAQGRLLRLRGERAELEKKQAGLTHEIQTLEEYVASHIKAKIDAEANRQIARVESWLLHHTPPGKQDALRAVLPLRRIPLT